MLKQALGVTGSVISHVNVLTSAEGLFCEALWSFQVRHFIRALNEFTTLHNYAKVC